MHYRHSYHAGNFADVFKHVAVCGLLDALGRKDSGWCFVDTHAGAGAYDLGGEAAATTAEWRDGIARLTGATTATAATAAAASSKPAMPALVARYLSLVRAFGGAEAGAYPGSPMLAAAIARPQDRLLLCERVPEVAEALRASVGRRATVHLRDGYESVSLLPPAEKRGLVLIDPPFERTDEYEAMADFIIAGVQRFAGGIYAAWYPIKNEHVASRFRRRVARDSGRPVLDLRIDVGVAERAEVARDPPQGRATGPRVQQYSPRKAQAIVKVRMHACGLLLVNPPFGFEAQAREALAFLTPLLVQGPRSGYSVDAVAA